MYNTESTKIFNKLLSIKSTLKGGTKFSLGNVTLDIVGNDSFGNLIQEWFGEWCSRNNFNVIDGKAVSKSSQTFPDFYVGKDSLLEIKTFNGANGPSFDIANFEAYCKSLAEFPERADADYLIFSYEMTDIELHIKDIWLKKIWEITCASDRYPLKTQVKKDVIYNIRPSNWYKPTKYASFKSKSEFIEALFETQKIYRGYSLYDEYKANLK